MNVRVPPALFRMSFFWGGAAGREGKTRWRRMHQSVVCLRGGCVSCLAVLDASRIVVGMEEGRMRVYFRCHHDRGNSEEDKKEDWRCLNGQSLGTTFVRLWARRTGDFPDDAPDRAVLAVECDAGGRYACFCVPPVASLPSEPQPLMELWGDQVGTVARPTTCVTVVRLQEGGGGPFDNRWRCRWQGHRGNCCYFSLGFWVLDGSHAARVHRLSCLLITRPRQRRAWSGLLGEFWW